MRRTTGILGIGLVAAYPVAIWGGLSLHSNRWVGLILIAILAAGLLVRLRWSSKAEFQEFRNLIASLITLAMLSVLFDDSRFLLFMPTMVNGVVLVAFGSSLMEGRIPMIERFARMIHRNISPERVLYCREVTKAWCVFFVFNVLITAWIAMFASLRTWALYTSVIAYILTGMMFAVEYAIRKIRFR